MQDFNTSEADEDECMSLDLVELQRTPHDRCVYVTVCTLLVCVFFLCLCVRVHSSLTFSLFHLLSFFLFLNLAFSLFLSLFFFFSG